MKIAYFDCIAGASGDMLLGALIDAGLSMEAVRAQLAGLRVDEFEILTSRVVKNGITATQVRVSISDDVHERHLGDILELVASSSLPEVVKTEASAIFSRLGEVEAGIHGVTTESVHLHELGGTDTLVDVTGVLCGLRLMEIERITVSPLPMGRGFVHSAHGQLPLPAPATLALLQGVPITGSEIEKELVTPTAAVLLTSLAHSFGPIPSMTLRAVGYGAGSRDLPIPNVLRVLLGESSDSDEATVETLAVLETNIDDLNPELYEYVIARAFESGALDVSLAPIYMKKNRPAVALQVLCRPSDASRLESLLFAETTTLGLRKYWVERRALTREVITVETEYGAVRVKLSLAENRDPRPSPEYEDCRRLAHEKGVPLWQVYRAAEQAANNSLDRMSGGGKL